MSFLQPDLCLCDRRCALRRSPLLSTCHLTWSYPRTESGLITYFLLYGDLAIISPTIISNNKTSRSPRLCPEAHLRAVLALCLAAASIDGRKELETEPNQFESPEPKRIETNRFLPEMGFWAQETSRPRRTHSGTARTAGRTHRECSCSPDPESRSRRVRPTSA